MRGDYSNSKIYRIVCNQTGLQYYGSTTQALSKRLSKHVCNYKCWTNGKGRFMTSFTVLEAEDYGIVLVEELPDIENVEQLRQAERRHIEGNVCVNKAVPGRTQQERKQAHFEANRDKQRAYNSEKVTCEHCGAAVRRDSLSKHQKTKKCMTAQARNSNTTLKEQTILPEQ